MIPFQFIYCRPDSLREAAEVFSQFRLEGKSAVYYAGGSEIISMCRTGSIQPDAVIDIKNIPECKELSSDGQALHIGSVCTLSRIQECNLFPLLRLACGRIADHTNQCRITLGGNLCGTIMYRETSLPLLIADAEVILFGPEGQRIATLQSAFKGQMQLKSGEFVVQVHVPVWALHARHAHVKKTANEKIDYPLVSMAAICKGKELRAAFSGICSYPFRSERMEAILNDRTTSCRERVEKAATLLPEPAYSDVEGSGEYRTFVFKDTLQTLLEEWENGAI